MGAVLYNEILFSLHRRKHSEFWLNLMNREDMAMVGFSFGFVGKTDGYMSHTIPMTMNPVPRDWQDFAWGPVEGSAIVRVWDGKIVKVKSVLFYDKKDGTRVMTVETVGYYRRSIEFEEAWIDQYGLEWLWEDEEGP